MLTTARRCREFGWLGVDAISVSVRILQGKVDNFFASTSPGGEADAEVIFGTLADAGVNFIHVTNHEAWLPAFEGVRDGVIA